MSVQALSSGPTGASLSLPVPDGAIESNTFDQHGTITNTKDTVRYPVYSDVRARRETYNNWARGMKQTADACAEAGFYYIGSGDKVVCFHCGVGIKDWEDTDIPWEEHVKWSPKCDFLLKKKGIEYINNVEECRRTCQKERPIPILRCHHAPYIIRQVPQNRSIILNAEAIMDRSSTQPGSNMCKKCETRKSNVVFLPCGHVNTCKSCSPLVQTCPTCRKTRTGAVRLYFS